MEQAQRSYTFPPSPLLSDVGARLRGQDDLDFILGVPITSRNPPMWFPHLMDPVSVEPVHRGKTNNACRLITSKTPQALEGLAVFTRFKSLKRS